MSGVTWRVTSPAPAWKRRYADWRSAFAGIAGAVSWMRGGFHFRLPSFNFSLRRSAADDDEVAERRVKPAVRRQEDHRPEDHPADPCRREAVRRTAQQLRRLEQRQADHIRVAA